MNGLITLVAIIWNVYELGLSAPFFPTSTNLSYTTEYPLYTSDSGVIYYDVDVYPSLTETTTSSIYVQYRDDNEDTYFIIDFNIIGETCIYPRISFEYEQIDISSSTEYISVYDNTGSLIKQCQGNGGADVQCTTWWKCLNQRSLGIDEIWDGSSYTITLKESAATDAFCGRYHSYSINSILTLTCNGNDIPSSTMDFILTTDVPAISYDVDVYPSLTETTTASAKVQYADDNSDTYFEIEFTINDEACIYPTITFEYEQIDIQSSTEYISVYDDTGSLIKQCQGIGGADSQCDTWWKCVNRESLGIAEIAAGSTYTITLKESAQTDALCDHSYSINSKLTLTCNGNDIPSSTSFNIPFSTFDETQGSISCGSVISGSTTYPGDVNYYYFSLSESTSIIFDVCNANYDTILYIGYPSNRNIYQCDDCGDCSSEYGSQAEFGYLSANDYIIGIGGFATEFGDYEIAISCDDPIYTSISPLSTFDVTDDGIPGKAQCGSIITGRTTYPRDINYYEFSLCEEATVVINSCGSGYDTWLYFQDEDGKNIENCDDCGACDLQTILTVDDVSPGDYKIGVGGFANNYGSYKVEISCYKIDDSQVSTTSPFDMFTSTFGYKVEQTMDSRTEIICPTFEPTQDPTTPEPTTSKPTTQEPTTDPTQDPLTEKPSSAPTIDVAGKSSLNIITSFIFVAFIILIK